MGCLGQFWLSCLGPLVLLVPNTFKLFGFSKFRCWAYLVKIIPEKRRAPSIWYLRFFSTMEARYTYIDMLSNNEYVCVHFNIKRACGNHYKKNPSCDKSLDRVAQTLIKFKCHLKFNWLFKITWNVYEMNLHLRCNWELGLLEDCAIQSW